LRPRDTGREVLLVHELAIAQRIVEVLADTASRHGGGRVLVARLALGRLTCVDPETLAFAFDVACRGTCAEGCRLDIERVPLVVECGSCGHEGERAGPVDPCPRCGGVGGEVRQGREFRLLTLDLDEDEVAGGIA
jgi:hydrogenase nickel incorporation protein HypA/HybF